MMVLTTSQLQKTYNGSIHAVKDLDLQIRKGEVFGLLGPNGAGKSTTIKMITGLLQPTAGDIEILGLSIPKQSAHLVDKIGYVPQELIYYEHLTIQENLELFAATYGIDNPKQKIEELIELLELDELRKRRTTDLSGGQKRRVNLAIGLLHQPELLILDEPSAGMDPQSRNILWESIERISREKQVTIILTTHLMETADRLSDRIAIIDEGTVIALGTPEELKDKHGSGDVLEIRFSFPKNGELLNLLKDKYPQADISITESVLRMSQQNLMEELTQIMLTVEQVVDRKDILSVNVHQNTLEDVFIALTGRELRE